MIRTSKTEYKKVAFEIGKQAEEYASSVVPYRLEYVFIGSSFEQRNGFVGHPLMSQYPQAAPSKRLEAVEANSTL